MSMACSSTALPAETISAKQALVTNTKAALWAESGRRTNVKFETDDDAVESGDSGSGSGSESTEEKMTYSLSNTSGKASFRTSQGSPLLSLSEGEDDKATASWRNMLPGLGKKKSKEPNRRPTLRERFAQALLSPAEHSEVLENDGDDSATPSGTPEFRANRPPLQRQQRWSTFLTENVSVGEIDASLEGPRLGVQTPISRLRPGRTEAFFATSPSVRITDKAASHLPEVCHGVFRVLDRDAAFGQSIGTWAIHNVALRKRLDSTRERKSITNPDNDKIAEEIASLQTGDSYHLFLDTFLYKQVFGIIAAYMVSIIFFALVYLLISDGCALGLEGSFTKAYLLSLETMITIGYGVPDSYMNGCLSATVVVTCQSLLQLIMSAFVIGVIFQRISSPQSRASTILFSQDAIIREIDGAHYFMFRLCDMRIQHALVEPHIRCYCLRKHHRRGWEFAPMRLQHPDDDLGATLLLTLPTTIVHRIDAWSPLSPAIMSHAAPSDSVKSHKMRKKEQLHTLAWPGTQQRQVDSESGARDSCICPTCGESFGTAVMLHQHCLYNAKADRASGYSELEAHTEFTMQELITLTHGDPSREDIEEHLASQHIEVVALVEGIEPTTSSTLQARHSWLIGGAEDEHLDVQWDVQYGNCCRVDPRGKAKGLVLDLSQFHSVHRIDRANESVDSL